MRPRVRKSSSLRRVARWREQQRLLACNVVGGFSLLPTADTVTSLVRLYDVSSPATPILLASANNTSGARSANSTGVGSLTWSNVTANSATLYAMSANQGIQAFTVSVVPEPGTYALAALGLGPFFPFRRR